MDDVFDLQDRITQDIVEALEVQLTHGEQGRVWRKRSGSPLVYEYFLKARSLYVNFDKHTHVQVRDQLERALQINPVFTPALYILGLTLTDQATDPTSRGIINFIISDNRVRFEIDEAAAEHSGLTISSKLPGLAARVSGAR